MASPKLEAKGCLLAIRQTAPFDPLVASCCGVPNLKQFWVKSELDKLKWAMICMKQYIMDSALKV